METLLKKTTKEEQKIAQSSITEFRKTSAKAIKGNSKSVQIKFRENDDFIKIPKEAVNLLLIIVSNMAEGRSFTLVPTNTVLGTQEAADMLNISRPHLVKLLEEGKIPFTKVGSHRRIALKHVIAFDMKTKAKRNEELDFLAKQAQDLNMGY